MVMNKQEEEKVEQEEEIHELLLKAEDDKTTNKELEHILRTNLSDFANEKERESVSKAKEVALLRLSKGKSIDLDSYKIFLQETRNSEFFAEFPKAKQGKILRQMLSFPSTARVDLLEESIEWAVSQKQSFLKQRLTKQLALVLYDQHLYKKGFDLLSDLIKEMKKIDDKNFLVELHLHESKFQWVLNNLPKAKAALTAAKSLSNSIYIVPVIQAELDLMAGILQMEEHDYKTAYSYFFESFETFTNIHHLASGLKLLKYMLLSKIANGDASEVVSLCHSKQALKYSDSNSHLLTYQTIAKAHEDRNLELFEETISADGMKQHLDDALVKRHLTLLYEKLLESNLLKLIEPFSCVEISHVAHLIQMDVNRIELKLSQMILDGKFHGILDQGKGQLILYQQDKEDQVYTSGLELIENVGYVVDTLFRHAEKLAY